MTLPLKDGLSSADDLRSELLAEDFVPGRTFVSSETKMLDGQVCDQVTCPNCGHHGMTYEPWVHPQRWRTRQGGYRPLAVCPNCPHGQEF